MNRENLINMLKILLVFIGIFTIYALFTNYPVISAYFDEDKYVEGEVFTPVNGEFDFRKFTLNSSQTRNFTTIIPCSGHTQFLDDKGNTTINIIEWDKMTNARRQRENSSVQLEIQKPGRVIDNVSVWDVDFLNTKLYSASINDSDTNTIILIGTPSEEQTVEMIKTLRFK